MIEYFPEPKSSEVRVKVELDFSNYAAKADIKNATGVNTSKFTKKFDLANVKSDVDTLNKVDKLDKVHKLDVDKLLPVSADLS